MVYSEAIKVSKKTKRLLDNHKLVPCEEYDSVLTRLFSRTYSVTMTTFSSGTCNFITGSTGV